MQTAKKPPILNDSMSNVAFYSSLGLDDARASCVALSSLWPSPYCSLKTLMAIGAKRTLLLIDWLSWARLSFVMLGLITLLRHISLYLINANI